MAFVGLVKPTIAKLTETGNAPTYSDGFICGKAIEVTINPQYAEGSLYGDDVKAEYDKEFKYADITLNTTTLPFEAHEIMFGHTVDSEKKNIKDSADDEQSYVGFGVYVPEKVDNKKKYIAMWIFKTKFSEGQETYRTKGDNIEYQTPSITGQAVAIDGGDWREREIFETAKEAQEWLKVKAGMETPTA